MMLYSARYLRAPSTDHRETLPHDRKCVLFYNPGPKIWGTPPPKKTNWDQKRAKFGRISDNFRLRPRISPERIKISKIGKPLYPQRFLPRLPKKSPVNFSPLTTKVDMGVWTHPNRLFRKTIFRPLRGAAPSNFYTR